jgi:hypothetical protein
MQGREGRSFYCGTEKTQNYHTEEEPQNTEEIMQGKEMTIWVVA